MTEAGTPPHVPTIRDVAARAGVSKSLVSLVLQDDPRVSAARREAVQAAMSELGYRPSRRARALSRSRTDTVGVLLNDLRNPWFIDLLAGLATTLRTAGLSPILADSHTDHRVGIDSIEMLLGLEVDGIIVVGTTEEELRIASAAEQVPVVLAGTREPHLPRLDVVVNDDLAGARSAARHLISLGHTRIGHIAGPDEIGAFTCGASGDLAGGRVGRRPVRRPALAGGRVCHTASLSRPPPPPSSRSTTSLLSVPSRRPTTSACAYPTTSR